MEGELQIARACLADVPALAGLLEELFAIEREFEPDRAAHEAGLRLLLTRPGESVIFVARREETVVGMVSLHSQPSTALGGEAFMLEDMIVTESERGRGVGGLLLDHALAHADRAAGRRVNLLADPGNDGALRFYARRGFRPSSMVVLRREPGGDDGH